MILNINKGHLEQVVLNRPFIIVRQRFSHHESQTGDSAAQRRPDLGMSIAWPEVGTTL